MEKRVAGGESLETPARFLVPRRYAQLCSAMCYKGKMVSKMFRVLGQVCFPLSGTLCSFMFYCTREYLERHPRLEVPSRRSNNKKFDPLGSSA